MTDKNEPLADSPAVAAMRMGISRSIFYIEMRAGHIETRKIGRRTLVPRIEQARWLAALPVSLVAAT